MDATRPLLEIRNLSVAFRARRRHTVRAVQDVSFDVPRARTFGLIGESGSGKTTLARAVAGLVPASGSVSFDGQDLGGLPGPLRRAVRSRIQLVFQDSHSALDPRMRIGRAVREPLDVARRSAAAERKAAVAAMLERVGLAADHARRYPHQLSGGQKQRVNIARALVLEPDLLICDESVSALDLALQAEILNLLQRLKDDLGLTLLFISHDLSVISHLSDLIGVMYLGRLVELGSAEDILARPLHPYTEALLSAHPDPYPSHLRTRERIVLTGDMPNPAAPPPGCAFHTRCRYVRQRCVDERPALQETPTGRQVACHYAEVLSLIGTGAAPVHGTDAVPGHV